MPLTVNDSVNMSHMPRENKVYFQIPLNFSSATVVKDVYPSCPSIWGIQIYNQTGMQVVHIYIMNQPVLPFFLTRGHREKSEYMHWTVHVIPCRKSGFIIHDWLRVD